MRVTDISIVLVAAMVPATLQADRISVSTPSGWQQWSMPGNAVEVTPAEGVKPVGDSRSQTVQRLVSVVY